MSRTIEPRENLRIEERERHITDLARIVASEQGEPKPDAPVVSIVHNQGKANEEWRCERCHSYYDEGDAHWNAHKGGCWNPTCRDCLPAEIAAGEVVLDRRSAHETLAFMLAGSAGREAYLHYFVEHDPESLAEQVRVHLAYVGESA